MPDDKVKSAIEKHGFYYQFFQRKYPAWLYAVAMGLFASGLYVWIKFFLVVNI